MKKFISIGLCLALLLGLIAACGPQTLPDVTQPEDSGKITKVAFVSDQPLDASEWLVNLVDGLEVYQTGHPELEIKMIEATQPSEFEPKIRSLAEEGYQLIITTYASMAEATIKVAKDHPDKFFGSLDGTISNISEYSNVSEFGLNRTETGYLGGVAAAAMSETNIVGIVGGMDEPIINAIIAGWQQGLRRNKPDIIDYVAYAGTWTDPTTGKDLGLALVDKGADVIAGAAGGTGAGTAQAAAERDIFYVAWDTHYDEIFSTKHLEIGSALNYFDKLVIKFIEATIAGNFQGGKRVELGMKEDVVSFDFGLNSPVTAEARALVEEALADIKAGKVQISSEPIHK